MSENSTQKEICVVIGASHGGVNFAFSLRKEGWEGTIVVIDKDPVLPYHRPPLSKAYLTSNDAIEKNLLKSEEAYKKQDIILKLGIEVKEVNNTEKQLVLSNGELQKYDKLVFATGASPIIPSIKGINQAQNVFPLRTAADVENIRKAFNENKNKRIVVIGGGYIGLETAASLKKLGASSVTVLEREERILARVTTAEMSHFFQKLHASNGVEILTEKNVIEISSASSVNIVKCSDNSSYEADIIVVGVGIRVNTELAESIGVVLENGIKVNQEAQTNLANVYAIGDCTYHFNPHYSRYVRLESVQNAVDQAKVAAASICGKNPVYDTIPWFWSDQYNVKLQMVGLSQGFNNTILRKEDGEENKFSLWYFNNDKLLAVDAVNNAKAYVIGTKFIKESKRVNKVKLSDSNVLLKPKELIED